MAEHERADGGPTMENVPPTATWYSLIPSASFSVRREAIARRS
jgi:hypothetical protein